MNTSKSTEPIAIVGIGCRFPGGVHNAKSFWDLLCKNVDAITTVPTTRWSSDKFFDPNSKKNRKMYMKKGGFLQDDISQFDPLFFGISPLEAEGMDPQQRLLLEVVYQAIEDAGMTMDQLKKLKTGVFIGGFCLDNLLLQCGLENIDLMNEYTATDISMAMLSNRVSHVFDLKGPSVSFDTACSSSLVSTHYAICSLQNNDCDVAIAGGVNLMFAPQYPLIMSKLNLLSPSGRSQAFDDKADGYVRGEGCGIVLLKKLSKAEQDNDEIYALIHSSGVNQDGNTYGITTPNEDAQTELIKEVYAKINCSTQQIGYIEAHGTGTQIGDKTELSALKTVFCEDKSQQKCIVGSVKTNIGHLEAAAGIAGLIKTSLCLKNKFIPANLHFEQPTRQIDFSTLPLDVATQNMSWPNNRGCFASVNSFGYGGTNAHFLLARYDKMHKSTCSLSQKWYVIALSAQSKNDLNQVVNNTLEFLSSTSDHFSDKILNDLSYTTLCRRSLFSHRLMLAIDSQKLLIESLNRYLNDDPDRSSTVYLQTRDDVPKVAFVFSGMGVQWWGMGQQLSANFEIFNQAIHEADSVFQKISGWSVLAVLEDDKTHEKVHQTEIAQPANFILQIGLIQLYKYFAIKPSCVMGHSLGEVAAAFSAGIITLEDATAITYHRSRLHASMGNNGGMLAVALSTQEISNYLDGYTTLEVSAINGPSFITVSGSAEEITQLSTKLSQGDIFNRQLRVGLAYHSRAMEPIKNDFIRSIANISPKMGEIEFYSTVEGKVLPGISLTPEYWWKNVRQSVQFKTATESILKDGCSTFLEIGAHPVLCNHIESIAENMSLQVEVISSLQRKTDEIQKIHLTLANIMACKIEISKQKLIEDGKILKLPTYPWNRKKFWKETAFSQKWKMLDNQRHPFLKEHGSNPHPYWEFELNLQTLAYLNDHCINDQVVFPAAGYIEMVTAALREFCEDVFHIHNLSFEKMVFLEGDQYQTLKMTVDPDSQQFVFWVKHYDPDHNWVRVASGWWSLTHRNVELENQDHFNLIDAIKKRANQPDYQQGDILKKLSSIGLHYGPAFSCIDSVWKVSKTQLLISVLPFHEQEADSSYLYHPGVLDSVFQALTLCTREVLHPYVPVEISGFTPLRSFKSKLWVVLDYMSADNEIELRGSFSIYDDNKQLLATVKDLTARKLDLESDLKKPTDCPDYAYLMNWVPIDLENQKRLEVRPKTCIFLSDNRDLAESMSQTAQDYFDLVFTLILSDHNQVLSEKSMIIQSTDQSFMSDTIKSIIQSKSDSIICCFIPSEVNQKYEKQLDYSMMIVNFIKLFSEMKINHIEWINVSKKMHFVKPYDDVKKPLFAMLTGFTYAASMESEGWFSKVIDLESFSPRSIKRVIEEMIKGSPKTTDVCYRSGKRHVLQLCQYDSLSPEIIKKKKAMKKGGWLTEQRWNDLKIAIKQDYKIENIIDSLEFEPIQSSLSQSFDDCTDIDVEKSYLIVGGISGFGSEILNWLLRKGAKSIIVASRRGESQSKHLDPIQRSNSQSKIKFEQLNVTKYSQVQSLVTKINATDFPLGGIFHLAMVLEDGHISEITKQQLDNVLGPKVLGVLNLHEATASLDLECFVLFSSLASLDGNQGQSNYVAANTFLDHFAFYRKSRGLVASVFNLGMIGQKGVAVKTEQLAAHIERLGCLKMEPKDIMNVVEFGMKNRITQMGVFDLDWDQYCKMHPRLLETSRFQNIMKKNIDRSDDLYSQEHELLLDLIDLDEKDQMKMIGKVLRNKICQMMNLDEDVFEDTIDLSRLGLDSLKITELRSFILEKFSIELKLIELMRKVSFRELINMVRVRMEDMMNQMLEES